MGLSKGARERALRGIVSGELWVGLAYTVEGKAVREVNDPSYSRRPVVFGDPVAGEGRSTIATSKAVEFAAFAFDSQDEIRNWFLIDKQAGNGEVIATGQLDPRWMTNGNGKLYTLAESALVAEKELLKPIYLRPLAGEGAGFDAGDIWLYIEEGQ